jgi:hypothetical protein
VNSIQAIRQAVAHRSPDRVNAIAIFTNPREFKAALGAEGIDETWSVSTDSVDCWESRIAWWDSFLTQIAQLVDAGVAEYATLSEIAAVFKEREANLVFDWEEIPRSVLGLQQRNIKTDYPLED